VLCKFIEFLIATSTTTSLRFLIVVGHKAVSVANPVVSFVDMLESVQEVLSVSVILEDGLLLVPS
jgi:hypothetical protein